MPLANMNSQFSNQELLLTKSSHDIIMPVKNNQHIRVSGYTRSTHGERADAAIIVFDLGEYSLSKEQLKVYNLKHSKVGLYSYLPVGQSEISPWTFVVPIFENLTSLKITISTWKNKHDVFIGSNIMYSNDLLLSNISLQKSKLLNDNIALQSSALKDKQLVNNVYKTYSFQLGHILLHFTKSFRNFINLPIDLYNLYIFRKDKLKRSPNPGWFLITDKHLSNTLNVKPGSNISFGGLISTLKGEKDKSALATILFHGSPVEPESAKRFGLQHSPKIGFYTYLDTSKSGENNWNIDFTIPIDCSKITITYMPWYNINPISISLRDKTLKQSVHPKIKKSEITMVKTMLSNFDLITVENHINASNLPSYHRADLYEVLADFESDVSIRSRLYLEAYALDHTYSRAVGMIRKVVDAGLIDVATSIINDFIRDEVPINSKDIRNVNYAKGYVALDAHFPTVPPINVAPINVNNYKALLFLHTSLPHHSNGYATRSHAILSTMAVTSKYQTKGVTRSGYPQDVGIRTTNLSDVIDGVSYLRMSSAHYYDQPINEYMKTASDDIVDILNKEKPTIVHSASAFYTALPALFAARKLGLPFVYEVRGLWEITRASTIPGWKNSGRFSLERKLETFVANEADQVITITNGIRNELIDRGVDNSKITIIPNAINRSHFSETPPNLSLKKELGLSNSPTIGYIGSVVDYEGIDDLLDALFLIKDKKIKFNFLLVGDGGALDGIRQKVKELNLQNCCFIIGRVKHDKVQDYYSLIDITPFPRKPLQVCEMVSPLKPFEAMALNKAVLVSSVLALKEIVTDNETGLIFEKNNIPDLALKLELLINNPKLRSNLASKSKDWVIKNRDWSQVALAFDDVYNKAFALNKLNSNTKCRETNKLSLLIYGDLNLNFVDGSAVWASSLVEMLSGFENISITFLLKADLTHTTLVESIKNLKNVRIISPSSTIKRSKLLKPKDAIDVIEDLHSSNNYDAIIIRGFELNKIASTIPSFKGKLCPYLIDVFHIKDSWDDEIISSLTSIIDASFNVFCQTTYIRDFLTSKIPEAAGKTCLLPPMVPDQPNQKKLSNLKGRAFRIVYAGKFAPLWGTMEMLETFKSLKKKNANIELHVYGDKIHNPPEDSSFRPLVEDILSNTDGIIWHKAKPRSEVLEALRTFDLAWAWRKPELENNTDEISTKFLEYSSVGLPLLVVGNKITTKLLTESYPLFVNAFADLIPTIENIIKSPKILKQASSLVYSASKDFSFSSVRHNHLSKLINSLSRHKNPKTILFAGHDLKFVNDLIDKFKADGYIVLIDKWSSHNKHNIEHSLDLLSKSDIVFCEWALGNAVWYSNHKMPNQKLFIRFHRQEIETEYPHNINYDAVDKMVFIVPHMLRKGIDLFNLSKIKDKLVYLPNYVSTTQLNIPKIPDARFNLGIVGIVPQMKRFDRALDILEQIRKKDDRYQLYIKGKLHTDYAWMEGRPDEIKYYEGLSSRIEQSSYLNGAVHFDGFDNDMATWFSKIGYVLSTSDFEGSHLSVAEGMASGSSPLIVKWDGADEIYPKKYCFNDTSEVSNFVLNSSEDIFEDDLITNKKYVDNFDINTIYKSWSDMI